MSSDKNRILILVMIVAYDNDDNRLRYLKRLWLDASWMRRGIVANTVRGKASGLDNI